MISKVSLNACIFFYDVYGFQEYKCSMIPVNCRHSQERTLAGPAAVKQPIRMISAMNATFLIMVS